MNGNTFSLSFLVLTLAGLVACSSKPPAKESKAPLDKIQGKAQILILLQSSAADAALNAGGPTVYLVDGLHRYRLFFKTPVEMVADKEYVAEGVYAQKVIDEIGDPDKGKNGYPLPASCDRVVSMAWPGLAFDVSAGHSSVLRATVKRYPARPLFLVTHLEAVAPKNGADSAESKKGSAGEAKEIPEVSVPADKQRAFLMEGSAVQPAPLWEPAGGTVRCKLIIGPDGKVSELKTGIQLCEAVPWSQFRYQPPVQRGRPVKVETEVEVRFEPRK